MANGIPIQRQYILVWEDGCVGIDWGDGARQDVLTGKFRKTHGKELCRPVMDHELERLIAAGRVASYDHRTVYMLALPERVMPTMD